ncbi:hypothetical protein OROMI_006406 [Orobanche minor]
MIVPTKNQNHQTLSHFSTHRSLHFRSLLCSASQTLIPNPIYTIFMTPSSPIVFSDPDFTGTDSFVPFTPAILSNGEYDPSLPFTIGPDSDLAVLGATKLGSKICVLGAMKLGFDDDVHGYDSDETVSFESEDDLVGQPSTKTKCP